MSEAMNRRAFMGRGAGASVALLGAGAGASLGTGTVAAQEDNEDEQEETGGLFETITGAQFSAAKGTAMLTARIVDGFSGMFADDRISQEEAEEVEESNLHQEVYINADGSARFLNDGMFTRFENMVVPDDPTQGALYNMAFSEGKAAVFEALREGKSVNQARSNGLDAISEYIAIRQKNYFDSVNLLYEDVAYYLEVYDQAGYQLYDNDSWSGRVLTTDSNTVSGSNMRGLDDLEVREQEYTLVNGETFDGYKLWFRTRSFFTDSGGQPNTNYHNDTYTYNSAGNSSSAGQVYVAPPSDFSDQVTWVDYPKIHSTWNTLEEVDSLVRSDFQDYTDEIYDLYDSGDIEDVEILSAIDLVTQFGESDGLTRSAAEMVAMGYNGPENLSDRVVVTSDSDDLDSQEGVLFLRWETDDEEGTIRDNIPMGREVTESEYQHALFSYDDGESADFITLTESWTVERVIDAEGNRVGESDIDADDEYETVIEDGIVRLFVEPVEDAGYVVETTDEEEFFILSEEFEPDDAEEPTEWTFDANETLNTPNTEINRVAVATGLGITSYNDQTADASRSIEEMERLAEGRDSVGDLETGGGAGALFGGVAAALGVGVGTAGAIVVGAVLLYVSILTR